MSDKEKLVELLMNSETEDIPNNDGFYVCHLDRYKAEYYADHLITHGVTVQEWIPVTERLPENEVDVLILAERQWYSIGKPDRKTTVHIVTTAFHTDGKMNTEESGYNWELDNVDMEYDEDADAFIVPEGWWEAVRYGEEFSAVDDFVTHWMPLPEPPKENEYGSNL